MKAVGRVVDLLRLSQGAEEPAPAEGQRVLSGRHRHGRATD
jgi:hypothetical protein